MPKDYKNINAKEKTRSGNPGQLKYFFPAWQLDSVLRLLFISMNMTSDNKQE